jgi:hypothetical protein
MMCSLTLAEKTIHDKDKVREVLNLVTGGKFSENQRLLDSMVNSGEIGETVRQCVKEEKSSDREGRRITLDKLNSQINLTRLVLDSVDDDQVIDRLLPRVLSSWEIINMYQLWMSADENSENEKTNWDKLQGWIHLTSLVVDGVDDDQVIDKLLTRVLSSQEIINTYQLCMSAVDSGDMEFKSKLLAQMFKLIGNER